jgi:hypothetical protein
MLTFTKACMEYFGKQPGQSLQDFAAELKALTEKDRQDFVKWFPSVGIEIEG